MASKKDTILSDKDINFSSSTILFGDNLLLQALDASNSGIIITDNMQPDSPIIYCNGGFERISGYRRHEIIRHNCWFLQMADRNQESRKLLREAI